MIGIWLLYTPFARQRFVNVGVSIIGSSLSKPNLRNTKAKRRDLPNRSGVYINQVRGCYETRKFRCWLVMGHRLRNRQYRIDAFQSPGQIGFRHIKGCSSLKTPVDINVLFRRSSLDSLQIRGARTGALFFIESPNGRQPPWLYYLHIS